MTTGRINQITILKISRVWEKETCAPKDTRSFSQARLEDKIISKMVARTFVLEAGSLCTARFYTATPTNSAYLPIALFEFPRTKFHQALARNVSADRLGIVGLRGGCRQKESQFRRTGYLVRHSPRFEFFSIDCY